VNNFSLLLFKDNYMKEILKKSSLFRNGLDRH
jgi:hypothetical protein